MITQDECIIKMEQCSVNMDVEGFLKYGNIWMQQYKEMVTKYPALKKTIEHQSVEILIELCSDIYVTCVQQFYEGYNPKIYSRHTDLITGAGSFYPKGDEDVSIPTITENGLGDWKVDMQQFFNPFKLGELSKHKGKDVDPAYVFATFMKGIRGFRELGNGGKGNKDGWGERFTVSYSNPKYHFTCTGTPEDIFNALKSCYPEIKIQIRNECLDQKIATSSFSVFKQIFV